MDEDTFDVTDQDGDVVTIPLRVSGDDHEVLEFNSSDILGFIAGHKPDYEEKSSYSITVEPRYGARQPTLDVTIEVVDTEDPGEVSLSQRQPQVGREVSAILSDPDGGVRIIRWEWQRSGTTVDSNGAPSAECLEDPDTDIRVVAEGSWTTIAGGVGGGLHPEAS